MSEARCVHVWDINQENVGHCLKCGEIRDFGALLKTKYSGRKTFTKRMSPEFRRGRSQTTPREIANGAVETYER